MNWFTRELLLLLPLLSVCAWMRVWKVWRRELPKWMEMCNETEIGQLKPNYSSERICNTQCIGTHIEWSSIMTAFNLWYVNFHWNMIWNITAFRVVTTAAAAPAIAAISISDAYAMNYLLFAIRNAIIKTWLEFQAEFTCERNWLGMLKNLTFQPLTKIFQTTWLFTMENQI